MTMSRSRNRRHSVLGLPSITPEIGTESDRRYDVSYDRDFSILREVEDEEDVISPLPVANNDVDHDGTYEQYRKLESAIKTEPKGKKKPLRALRRNSFAFGPSPDIPIDGDIWEGEKEKKGKKKKGRSIKRRLSFIGMLPLLFGGGSKKSSSSSQSSDVDHNTHDMLERAWESHAKSECDTNTAARHRKLHQPLSAKQRSVSTTNLPRDKQSCDWMDLQDRLTNQNDRINGNPTVEDPVFDSCSDEENYTDWKYKRKVVNLLQQRANVVDDSGVLFASRILLHGESRIIITAQEIQENENNLKANMAKQTLLMETKLK